MGTLSMGASSQLIVPSRAERLTRLEQERFDLLVIGGGITGAGVCREAARRGWRVALVEQRDFAWGTSSRSSKLVHGGLRYLKQGQLRLTLHSVRERDRLMREAPELVQAQSFLIADCPGRKPSPRLFQLGLMLYDAMAGQRSRAYVSADVARALVPGLAAPLLRGATLYRDAKTDDARLVMRVLAEAELDGALVLNQVTACQPLLEGGRVCGLSLQDNDNGRHFTVKAGAVINASGVWCDTLRAAVGGQALLRPLRGSHLLLPFWRLPLAQAVSLMHPRDGRPVFMYPWEGAVLIGTTDLDHEPALAKEATITTAEVDYLLQAVNDQFPQAVIVAGDVLSCFAGVRPVLADGSGDPSAAAREHVVLSESGLITVCGGKLTTFRTMAQDALAIAAPLLGKVFEHDDGAVLRAATPLPVQLGPVVQHRLAACYGIRAASVAALAREGELATVPGTPTLWLELRVAALTEAVCHLDDLLLRRTRLGLLLPQGGLEHEDRIRTLCQGPLSWTDARWNNEVERYRDLIDRCYRLPVTSTPPPAAGNPAPIAPMRATRVSLSTHE